MEKNNYYILLSTTITVLFAAVIAVPLASAQKGLSSEEQKGFNKFVQDWKKVCPDSNNMTSFCDGYLTGASVRSSGP